MSDFAKDLEAFAQQTKDRADLVTRKVAIDILARVIRRSPVGNPELWAANAHALSQRKNYNIAVDQLNAQTLADPSNQTASGAPRRGVNAFLLKRQSASALAKAYPLTSGKGYIGGRFRANWRLSIGQQDTTTTKEVDPNGSDTNEREGAKLAVFELGKSIYIMNSLPYSLRLEDGYSKQSPAGMVKITVAEFKTLVDAAVSELPR